MLHPTEKSEPPANPERFIQAAFRDYQMGLSSSGAVIIFALNVAFTLAYVRVLRPQEGAT